MRIAICDDNAAQRESLIGLLRVVLSDEAVSCQLREYTRAQDLLYDVQDGEWVDAVFADMSMTGGWESVQTLREEQFGGFLVLMSDCGKRAVEGYSIEADGYLTKPYRLQDVRAVLVRLCTRVKKACLTIHSHARIVRVPHEDILYIESRNAKCVVHCADHTEYTVYAHLDDLEKALSDPRFLRCHQSYLVNMDHIISADRQFVMANGDVVSIRQRECRRLREEYRTYVCAK